MESRSTATGRAINPDYQIARLANGTCSVRCNAVGETFHPVAGPAAEAGALYVRQLRLRERMSSSQPFVIWDVGLGAAANPITALRSTTGLAGKVHIVSFDHTTAPLEFALNHTRELDYLIGFERQLQALLSRHHVQWREDDREISWSLHLGDFPGAMLHAPALRHSAKSFPDPDVIFFDAFSPARNPEMWSLPTLTAVYQQLRRPCALATFSRSTIARTGLLLSGFYVGRGEGLAGKEETTIAANDSQLIDTLLGPDWFARAERSHAAEPLRTAAYIQCPLSPGSRSLLATHPQFAGMHKN